MSKSQSPGPRRPPAHLDPDLVEFARRTPQTPADPRFQQALHAALWELLLGLVARLRGRS